MDIFLFIKKLRMALARPVRSSSTVLGAGVLGAAMVASPAVYAGAKGVVELYTSQGCSSCPPADKLAHKYAQDPDLVVLTLPVTYWDYLGWKDTFAKKAFTDRQYQYATLRGDRSVYTPQVVVNGGDHAIGSNAGEINPLLARESLPVEITIKSTGDYVDIDVAGRTIGKNGTLWLALVKKEGIVAIGRGENRNRTVTYTNIVREIRPLGEWNGDAMTVKLSKADIMVEEADGFAVLLQSKYKGYPSDILGAAMWNGS